MKREGLSYAQGLIGLPPPLSEAIYKAQVFAEEGDELDVYLEVDAQQFSTWWNARDWGRRSEHIELTPVLTIRAKDGHLDGRAIVTPLIFRGTDRGDCWVLPEVVEDALAFVLDGTPIPKERDARAPGPVLDDPYPSNDSPVPDKPWPKEPE